MGHIWKRTLALLLAAVLVLGVLPGMTVKAEAAGTAWKQFYVSPDGNDDNNGATAETAFATIGRARDAVDAVNEDMKGDIVVNVAPGTYYVTETINFDESDSGMNGYEVVYRCTGDPGSARILGGRAVTETWELATADDPDLSPDMVGKVWKVELPVDTVDFNTLYVDGSRATMARTPNAANDPRFPAGKDTYLYATGGASGGYGISVPGGTLTAAQREAVTAAIARGEEGCQVLGWDWGYHNWFTSTLPITGISGNTLTSTPVEGNPQANRPKYVFTSGARFFLQGNLSFLDVPGEYHYNKQTNTLYYYPAEGEDLRTVEVIIPQVQEIFHLESASLDKLDVSQASDPEKQVHNLTFYGLEAGYTDFTDSYSSGWNAFDTYGCGVYPEEALREGITQPSYCEQTERAEHRKGVFTLFQTNHITLDSMRIVNTGYMGFCAWGNNDHITIQNSEFSHIGFHGINIDGGYPGPESGKYSYGHLVTNNVIHDMGELVGHGTGIQALQLHDSEFSHMEMYNAARRAIFLEGAWACRTAQDADFNRVRDSATYNNHLEYLYLHDLQQDGGDDGAIFVCTLYRYQTGYAGNGVDDTKPNYLDQIYMDAVGAPSSNKDFKPNCINFDMGCGGVIASNIKAVNPQHYNIRYNEGQGEVTFENVNMAYYHPMADSNYKNFDESKMEYDQIGVNSSFPYPDAVTHLTEKTYEDVYYREEFDNGFEDWWTLAGAPENSPLYFSDNADWAGKCFLADAFYNKSADGCRIGKPFGVDLNKVVEIDFFDHMCDGMENGYCGMTFQYNLNSFARVDNGSAVRAMGVDTSVSFQYFCYKIGSITRVSSVPRAYGWHTLKWDYTDGTNVKMYIDDVLVATVPSASFNYIEMGDYGMGGFNAYDNVVIYGGQYAEDPMPLPEQPEPEAPEEETLTLPGRIEAEDTDTLPSTARIDSGYGTGKAITYVSLGDEYCYDVTVTEDMDLPFVVSCAVNGSAKLEVYVDGEASPRMTLTPANGNSWTKFKDTIGENLKLSAGTHTIKIKVLNNALNIDYFECKQPVKATSVQAEVNGDLILGKDTSVKVPVLVLPENASEKAVTWSSDNTGVVTVDADGTLHTLAVGEANITVKLASGESVSDTFTVKVEDAEAYLINTEFYVDDIEVTGLKTAAPVASVESGEYESAIDVTLSVDDPAARIFYTLDGSDPKINGEYYLGDRPVTVDHSCTLKAVAISSGMLYSEVVSYDYTILAEAPVVDKTALEALVEEAEALKEEDYTEETWSDLAEALTAAKSVLADEDATQEEVDAAEIALRNAIGGLTEKPEEPEPEVDKSALEGLYNDNKDRQQGNYTKPSWEAFREALANAEAVLNDPNATQEEVDAAVEALRDAIDGLQEKPIFPVLPIIPGNSASKPTEEMSFTDVSKGDWFYEDVKYVYENGIMNGVSDTRFAPQSTLTRAMVVTILYRMEGEPSTRYNALFPDVENNQWYTKGVEWAANNGIVLGYTTGKFGPNDPVTREQLAAILYRYAQSKNYVLAEGAALTGYADASNISPYAVTAVQWSVTENLLEGTDGKLLPRQNATRAEVAHAIAGFCQNVG